MNRVMLRLTRRFSVRRCRDPHCPYPEYHTGHLTWIGKHRYR
jgi:hypothetical protein